ncbi:MAG: hypothetical protein H7Y60_10565 [Rhodospirillaceae bacterium]|nr:hypothetical protein [Rhodospirillales bacterium]
MTRAQRSRLKWAVTASSLLWMVLVGWLMVTTLPQSAVENHGSAVIKDRMSDCTGSYRDRYDCKEQIIIESGRDTFFILGGRFLLVVLPPLLMTGWLSSYLRKHPVQLASHHHVDAGDWKARAQMHTETQSPEQAAEELHLSENDLPHLSHKGHHLIDDIAPVDDWKARAHVNTHGHGPKREG